MPFEEEALGCDTVCLKIQMWARGTLRYDEPLEVLCDNFGKSLCILFRFYWKFAKYQYIELIPLRVDRKEM